MLFSTADSIWFALAHLGAWKPLHWTVRVVSLPYESVARLNGGTLEGVWGTQLPPEVVQTMLNLQYSAEPTYGYSDPLAPRNHSRGAYLPAYGALREKQLSNLDIALFCCRKYLDILGKPECPDRISSDLDYLAKTGS